MKKTIKLLALLLALVMVLSCFAGCKRGKGDDKTAGKEYTYRGYTAQLGTSWNPHTWETNYDSTIMGYLETPLVTMSIKDSGEGVYQWVYKAATSITDVTKDHKDDLSKYKVTLPKGQTAEQTDEGYVFEIKLNPDMKWENGTPIDADTYIYSMKALLDPTMMNYRANLYYNGESAVAGGYNYYYALSKEIYPVVSYKDAVAMNPENVYVDLWAAWGAEGYTDANGNECPQYVTIADATVYGETQEDPISGKTLFAEYNAHFKSGDIALHTRKANENYNENYAETYDAIVGCYKVDAYTIRYVTQAKIDINYFLTSCTSNWLVYQDLYEKGKETAGKLVTTNYGTSMDTTMSYGPYKLSALQENKQVVFVQNENYYEYEKKDDGSLYAETDYLVDGEHVRSYQTTKIVIDVMTDEAAKQAFLKGQLSEWTPPADEMMNYMTSSQMFMVDETYTYAFFFNSNVKALKEMDKSKGNQNSIVLSSDTFRKAFSLAIDRDDWVTATAGYKPSYYLMSDLYYYDIYNNPNSTYRGTTQAMQGIVDLYGVTYVDGGVYQTVEEAYASINGYNLSQAKDLMRQACNELVAANLYRAGEEIKIRVAYSGGPLSSSNHNQITKINQYLNEAMEDSGFGKITLEAIGDIENRHDKVPQGEYAIGYGAWGGAAFYPFRNMQVYCDTEENKVNELGCWNPAVETLTIKVGNEEITMTWQDWSRALVGTGPYADATMEFKLLVTATMEKEFLAKYYRIPLATSCASFLQSYQLSYYTDVYNVMYDFGGFELLNYHYSDAEWEAYVAKSGGTLVYE